MHSLVMKVTSVYIERAIFIVVVHNLEKKLFLWEAVGRRLNEILIWTLKYVLNNLTQG